MEWIRISSNKLKIMLSAEDARRYALNCETADYADPVTREAFREILTDVRQKTDFDAAEDKIYIQMYPSKEGGCELFVTKVGLLLSEHGQHTSNAPKHPKAAKMASISQKRHAAMRFSSCTSLTALCRRLQGHFKGESEVWQDESGAWWLCLCDHGNPLLLSKEFPFLAEYGTPANAAHARLWLPEHGKRLCAMNAIETFSKL